MSNAQHTSTTVQSYARSWAVFQKWCTDNGLAPLPAKHATVRRYLEHVVEQGRSWSSVRRAAYAIIDVHRTHGHGRPDDLVVAELLTGLRERIAASIGETHEEQLRGQGRAEELNNILQYLHELHSRSSDAARATIEVLVVALGEARHRRPRYADLRE